LKLRNKIKALSTTLLTERPSVASILKKQQNAKSLRGHGNAHVHLIKKGKMITQGHTVTSQTTFTIHDNTPTLKLFFNGDTS
jgi:hypothetical protein